MRKLPPDPKPKQGKPHRVPSNLSDSDDCDEDDYTEPPQDRPYLEGTVQRLLRQLSPSPDERERQLSPSPKPREPEVDMDGTVQRLIRQLSPTPDDRDRQFARAESEDLDIETEGTVTKIVQQLSPAPASSPEVRKARRLSPPIPPDDTVKKIVRQLSPSPPPSSSPPVRRARRPSPSPEGTVGRMMRQLSPSPDRASASSVRRSRRLSTPPPDGTVRNIVRQLSQSPPPPPPSSVASPRGRSSSSPTMEEPMQERFPRSRSPSQNEDLPDELFPMMTTSLDLSVQDRSLSPSPSQEIYQTDTLQDHSSSFDQLEETEECSSSPPPFVSPRSTLIHPMSFSPPPPSPRRRRSPQAPHHHRVGRGGGNKHLISRQCQCAVCYAAAASSANPDQLGEVTFGTSAVAPSSASTNHMEFHDGHVPSKYNCLCSFTVFVHVNGRFCTDKQK